MIHLCGFHQFKIFDIYILQKQVLDLAVSFTVRLGYACRLLVAHLQPYHPALPAILFNRSLSGEHVCVH